MLLHVSILAASLLAGAAAPADDSALWNDFKRSLRAGEITAGRIHPYFEGLRGPMAGFVEGFRTRTKAEEWEATPEIHRVGNRVHFIIPLTVGSGVKGPYCFTIIEEEGGWFFQHVESIFIRLDQLGPLPTSTYPDLPEEKKTWMREENTLTDRLRFHDFLVREKGVTFAQDWIGREADGYFLAARTWVPFVPPARAFILYLCWEQSRLRGSPATLERLDDDRADVTIDAIEWRLHRQTAHLRRLLPAEDFRQFYETVWRRRAAAAGWNVDVQCGDSRCRLAFTRAQDAPKP